MLNRNTFTIGAGLLTPPKRPTEGLLFYSTKSITPGDSQVRM